MYIPCSKFSTGVSTRLAVIAEVTLTLAVSEVWVSRTVKDFWLAMTILGATLWRLSCHWSPCILIVHFKCLTKSAAPLIYWSKQVQFKFANVCCTKWKATLRKCNRTLFHENSLVDNTQWAQVDVQQCSTCNPACQLKTGTGSFLTYLGAVRTIKECIRMLILKVMCFTTGS